MTRLFVRSAMLAAFLAIAPLAWGQTLLDQVEKKVEKEARGGAPKAGGKAAPAGDAAAPAERPPAGIDELPPPPVPAAKPGYLGVVLDDRTRSLMVEEVTKDSPADKAGLKTGDKITAANKVTVSDIEELGVVLDPLAPGDKLTLSVVRDGKPMTIEATLGDSPPKPARGGLELGDPLGPGAGDVPARGAPGEAPAPRADTGPKRASLGITVVTFGAEQRRTSDVTARGGAMITGIRPESPAARAGLPLGGVIVAYDGAPIDTADQLVEAIRSSRPGQEVEVTYYPGGGVGVRRKAVTLAAAADPILLGPGYGGLTRDRPALNRIERAIEGLTRPGGADAGPGGVGAAIPRGGEDTASLREEVEALKARVEALEMKVAELEAKLPAEKPGPGAEGAPAAENPGGAAPIVPGDEGAPTLRPPTRRPPTKAPGAKIGDE